MAASLVPEVEAGSELLHRLEDLRRILVTDAAKLTDAWTPLIHRGDFAASANNLAAYLALRQLDLRELQLQLMPWGLSSIGRSESRVMETLDNVIATLRSVSDLSPRVPPMSTAEFFHGDSLLNAETDRVFGRPPANRRARIMVTFPTEAATSYDFVRDALLRGMNLARINCAHDSATEWLAMIENIRRAEHETGLSCKISMDLAGPKIRVKDTNFKKKHRFVKNDLVVLVKNKLRKDVETHQISCTLDGALDHIELGHQVWFDDGLIGARVVQVQPEAAVLRIEHVSVAGERIRPEKGINFPDTHLDVQALTSKDLEDLDFVSEHADIINFSFVQTVDDVLELRRQMGLRLTNPARIAIIAKIETRRAVENLPKLIVACAGYQPFGVMIARGDLAVEIGFERLSEIQEELLWLCEAAHTPVVWATQVFENFVKTGVPTRSEVTDAAMAERAECVMLNKGEFVTDAVELLDHVLVRMQGHQFKKRAELRALKSWPLDEMAAIES